jgi:hypothetical protein
VTPERDEKLALWEVLVQPSVSRDQLGCPTFQPAFDITRAVGKRYGHVEKDVVAPIFNTKIRERIQPIRYIDFEDDQ